MWGNPTLFRKLKNSCGNFDEAESVIRLIKTVYIASKYYIPI